MENKNAVISARIMALIADGATIEQAINTVLGAGSYPAIVDAIYEQLRKGRA
jgi:hypothetical protein